MKHFMIRATVYCFIILAITAFVYKCTAGPKYAYGPKGISGEWKLLTVLTLDTATGKIPILNFDISAGTFVGNTGCNNFSGKMMLNADKLSFSEQSVLTQNNCQGYNEDAFMASLIKVNHYKIKNGVLQLMVDETVLSKWVRREPVNKVKKM